MAILFAFPALCLRGYEQMKGGNDMEYCITDIMAQVRICLQSVISGNKKMVSENEAFKITVYQMGTISNIRIDIKEN